MTKNILELFIDKLFAFPLWVKQVIFLRLHNNLSENLSEDFITIKEDDVFHLYVPVLSYAGKTELSERKCGLDTNMYNFMENVSDGFNMLEISMNNFWTMEEVAKYFILCLEQDYIKPSSSIYVTAMAGFMSGKYRTGEYFKRVGKIDVDQLEQTIIKQKEYAEQGTPMKMAAIMISLGFITEKDTRSLLILKEESKKRFILDANIVPKAVSTDNIELQKYKDENAKLLEQNKLLKNKLTKILAFVKKNG